MHKNLDTIRPGELSIARNAIQGDELEALGQEIDELWQRWPAGVFTAGEAILSVTESIPLADLSLRAGSVVGRIVDIYDVPEDAEVGLNTYAPMKKGNFHTHGRKRAMVVHPTGNGTFDFAPDAKTPFIAETESLFTPYDLNAGDIVLSSGKVLHRGANKGNTPRRNMVFLHD